MKLKNENSEYTISSTNAEASYDDCGNASIMLGGYKNSSPEKYVQIKITFRIVAEFKCITLNFYEHNYMAYEIISDNNVDVNEESSGFYLVLNSKILQEMGKSYDPLNRLKLKHYIVTGGDGYFEIIASGYLIELISDC